MAEATFPKELGGDGSTVTDDDNPDTGLDGVGYMTRFVPALANTVAMARFAKGRAEAAQAFAEDCQALRDDVATRQQDVAAKQQAASKSATAAKASETAAGQSASAAKSSETVAAGSASNAKTSETNSGKSATAAASSESNAKSSETAASGSADSAASSASAASASKTAAAGSASAAKSSETAAGKSATAAKSSETAAAGSAKTARDEAAKISADDVLYAHGSGHRNTAGTAATRDVGAESGQLMEVGAFGLGDKRQINYNNNHDYLTVPPGAVGNNGSVNTPSNAPGGGRWGGFKFGVYHAGMMFLRGDGRASDIFVRGWGFDNEWEEEYRTLVDSRNLVGSVGANLPGVIERGSNANGEYVKLADGTLICTHTIEAPAPDIPSGNLYKNASVYWTFPHAFNRTVVPDASVLLGPTSTWAAIGDDRATAAGSSFCLYRTAPASGTARIGLTCIGNWK